MVKVPNEAITHLGRFHADDVFSAALLRILNPDIKIYRKNQVPEDFEGLVFDLNGGEYDHHNDKLEYRSNGVPYASFGLLWRTYGPDIVGENAAFSFDESFIQPLDIQDNYGGNNQLARAITQANPKWDSSEDPDICFEKAVEFAKFILNNEIESMHSTQRAKLLVEDALRQQENGIVVLNVGVPWKSVLIPAQVYYVVYPSTRGGYNAQAVPKEIGSKECKRPFPELWRGKNTNELQELIGIKGINFCHPGGYLLNGDIRENVVKACNIANELYVAE